MSLETGQQKIQLPCDVNFRNGLCLTLREAKREDLPAAYSFFMKYGFDGHHGVSIDEYTSEQDFITHNSRASHKNYLLMKGEEIVVLAQSFPSPFMRSIYTVYNSGYMVRNPAYRGVSVELMVVITRLAAEMGYTGNITRSTISNTPAIIVSTRMGRDTLGIVPLGVQVSPGVWMDDVMMLMLYDEGNDGGKQHKTRGIDEKENLAAMHGKMKTLERMSAVSNNGEDTIPREYGAGVHGKVIKLPGTELTLMVATKHERAELERMMEGCARNGKLFGVDEFINRGVYSRKMLRKSITVVAKNPQGVLVGGLLFGAPFLARSPRCPLLGVYVVTDADGTEDTLLIQTLYRSAIELAVHHRLQGVITDVLSCDRAVLQCAIDVGMCAMGTVPNSAYVHGRGYTDAVVMRYRHARFAPKM